MSKNSFATSHLTRALLNQQGMFSKYLIQSYKLALFPHANCGRDLIETSRMWPWITFGQEATPCLLSLQKHRPFWLKIAKTSKREMWKVTVANGNRVIAWCAGNKQWAVSILSDCRRCFVQIRGCKWAKTEWCS